MLSKKRKAEYRGLACHRCHQQKVKCSRERPCQNCTLSRKPCTYAVRDKKVTVSETYLKQLEAEAAAERHLPTSPEPHCNDPESPSSRNILQLETGDFASAVFISGLKQLQGHACGEPRSPSPDAAEPYEYFSLSFDTSRERCTFKLPPYPYALHLLEQFTIYFGYDWHWFRMRSFRQRVTNTYMVTNSPESKDRNWLCKLLVVLAMGESANAGNSDGPAPETRAPPGTEFFEQALRLIIIPYEEASLDHIETLNLIAIHSNQLNRQKTAFMYTGTSARMCNMLQLHRACSSRNLHPVEIEHRKRVWWSTYCLDRMTSTQRGILPTLHADQTDLELPSKFAISDEDAEEFGDAAFLKARIELTIIQADAPKVAVGFAPGGVASIGCLILLLRPFLLSQVAELHTPEPFISVDACRKEWNTSCLHAARSSIHILITVQSVALLARLGLMENIHLFTSLVVLRLAIALGSRRPDSFNLDPGDSPLYDEGKNVLLYMLRCGSLAAKGHLRMLQEVEDVAHAMEPADHTLLKRDDMTWDIDAWISQLLDSDIMMERLEHQF
ncbi:Zn(II)2Cys6 transcription factor [Aspergillus stella-maris]|uniref:Zn(II)2Cys6 transcription factor n=1 Tax=Aspergillus stella-maris TaxID=1810926 RepID=UPI003CCD225C